MAYKETALSCTIYQNWIYGQTGGSAGGSKLCMSQQSCTVSQLWAWDGSQWVTSGAATNNSPSTMFYGPDSEGYSGYLDRYAVSGDPLPPSGSGSNFETRTTSTTGTAYYSKQLTKPDTRTYGWSANGSQTHTAPSSVSYDDGTYAGTLYLYSVVGTPPTPGWTSTEGATTTTDVLGIAYYDGDVPRKLPGAPTNFRVTSFNTESANLAWDALSNADTYNIEVYLANTSTVVFSSYDFTETTKFVTGLFSDTAYDIKLYARNTAGTGTPVWIYGFTTQAQTPPPSAPTGLAVSGITQTKATASWSPVSGATSYSAEVYLQGTQTVVASAYTFAGTSKEFTGLTANTAYTVKVWGVNATGNGTASYENFATPPVAPTRPSNWTWASLVSSATTYGTTKLRANLVTASEWNSFTARINEFRTYKGLATISFSSASSSGDFTQNMYNEAVNAISSMATVNTTGGPHTKLVNLKNALNSIV